MQFLKILTILVGLAIVAVAGYTGLTYFHGKDLNTSLLVYSADAYVQESNHYLNAFHNQTGMPVATAKGAGSFTAAREIGQGGPANVFISVSLDSYNKSYLGNRYPGWTVAFASDQLVLAYSNLSHTSEVNSIVSGIHNSMKTNSSSGLYSAFSNLTSGKVTVGISDPASDPAGLRGWISLEIAGNSYDNGNNSYFTQRMLHSGGLSNSSSAALLVSPLVSGQVQFLFIYKSAAISKGLKYVSLPENMNFGNPSLSHYYSSFTYNTSSGVGRGSPILLYVSALGNNSNMAVESINFVTFVLNHTLDMATFGLLPLSTPVLYNNTAPPLEIRNLVILGKVKVGGTY